MFFKKANDKDPESLSVPPKSLKPNPGDAALDSVAALMRSYGKYALDIDNVTSDEIRKECDDWAANIVMGRAASNDDGGGPPSGARRDFGGLLAYFERTRSHESDFLSRSQQSLRAALQQFAACLAYALAADRQADGGLEQQLQSLAESLDGNNPDRIRSNADRVLKAARLTLLERRQREVRQVEILAEKFNQLKAELVEARTQATTDTLTQLYNRNALDQHLERIADWGVLFQYEPALIFVDVDYFKSINDSHGHSVGDQVLRSLADVMTRCFLRRQDFVARYGGEEFAIVAVETQPETLQTMADRLLDSVRKMNVLHAGQALEITVSLGIARLTRGERPSEWIERADKALYEAKRRGRDRMVLTA